METDHEIYPMPLFPRLTVSDVAESTEWYRALGFDVVYSMPATTHVRYRKYADVILVSDGARPGDGQKPAEAAGGAGVVIYVSVEDETVDDVAKRATEFGTGPSSAPRETAWNTREVVLEDPNGYEIAFSEPVDAERSFEDVTGGPERSFEDPTDGQAGSR